MTRDFFLSLFLSLCHPKGVKKSKARDDAFFSTRSFLGAQKEAPRPHPFKGVLLFFLYARVVYCVSREKIILKLKTCCKSGKEHRVYLERWFTQNFCSSGSSGRHEETQHQT